MREYTCSCGESFVRESEWSFCPYCGTDLKPVKEPFVCYNCGKKYIREDDWERCPYCSEWLRAYEMMDALTDADGGVRFGEPEAEPSMGRFENDHVIIEQLDAAVEPFGETKTRSSAGLRLINKLDSKICVSFFDHSSECIYCDVEIDGMTRFENHIDLEPHERRCSDVLRYVIFNDEYRTLSPAQRSRITVRCYSIMEDPHYDFKYDEWLEYERNNDGISVPPPEKYIHKKISEGIMELKNI